jgi:competence protein ComEC
MMAVSGFHLAVVFMVLSCLVGMLFSGKVSQLGLAGMLLIYLILVGSPLSIVRAWIMLFFALIFQHFFHKQYQGIYGLLVCLLLMSLFNPLYLMDVGFQLSFAASAGILGWNGQSLEMINGNITESDIVSQIKYGKYVNKIRKISRKVMKMMQISWAAQIATLPIVVNVFEELSIFGWLSTLVFSAVITVIVIGMCLILLLLTICGWSQMWTAEVVWPFAWVLNLLVSRFVVALEWADKMWGQLWAVKIKISGVMILAYYVFWVIFVLKWRKRRKKYYEYLG